MINLILFFLLFQKFQTPVPAMVPTTGIHDLYFYNTPPLVATTFDGNSSYIAGLDGKFRHCPKDYTTYIRIEGKGFTPNFFEFKGPFLYPKEGQYFTIMCGVVK